jgi:L-aspartate oxidase
MTDMETDFLVIGAGLSGLTYALLVADRFPDKKVLIITKDDVTDSNTNYAQGGIAIVQNESDSFEKHVQDTLLAGDGLCDQEIVEMVVKEGPNCLERLLAWGVNFDSLKSGEFDTGREGGHSENRILHHKDVTGAEIGRALRERLMEAKNIELLPFCLAIDLILDEETTTCMGAYVLDEKREKVFAVSSKITFLAAGGAGQLYLHTTNPTVATGDAIAMAYRIGARIKEVEFIQFHPTALYQKEESPAFLISEAVRGFGASLITQSGERFMEKYDSRGELASRDIVARAIEMELQKSGDEYVYLDCTNLDQEPFKKHFPNIIAKCRELGIDILNEYIPVHPAAHYICGGIVVDNAGQTAITNLLACGECTRTGLHGANRLASNSLLEAFVYAERAAHRSMELVDEVLGNRQGLNQEFLVDKDPKIWANLAEMRSNLQRTMNNHVGVVRSHQGLRMASEMIREMQEELERIYNQGVLSKELCELRNLLTVAMLVVDHSHKRGKNLGGYYNIDLGSL